MEATPHTLGTLEEIRAKPARLIVGLMSGTSADGVDAVLCEIRGYGRGCDARVLWMSSLDYPPQVRRLLLGDLCRLTVEEVARLNFLMGEVFAEAALRCISESGLHSGDIDAISSHGQTIAHFPDTGHPALPIPATLQVGDISVIAQRTGVLTVGDFRPADMAQGGQGAPLVPYADYVLLAHPALGRVVQNIGGIANCTYLPPSCSLEDIVAFDTGPGNMVVDAVVSVLTGGRLAMDEDARMASRGRVDRRLLAKFLDNPYFRIPPPKSTGREVFGVQYARAFLEAARNLVPSPSESDIVATASELTVATIVQAYRSFILPRGRVDEVIVGGGGSRNPYFMRRLVEKLAPVKVMRHEDAGIDGKAKEALAFAILGNELIGGNPNSVPAATGARKAVVMGKIALP
jgi:anhydro-N-acetylmuramic acid kinase